MDAHGVQNLFAEEDAWATNLMTAQSDAKSDEIIGGNLNSLLKGLILLFSKQYKYLPCPPNLWSEAIGSIFLCLYKCSLLESCLHRLDVLFIQLENYSTLNIPKAEIVIYCRGAIEFLKTWVIKFPHCLTEEDFVKLHHVGCKLNHKLTTHVPVYSDLRIDVADLYKVMSTEMQTRYSLYSIPPTYDYHMSIEIPLTIGTFSASGGNETATEKLKASLASKENKFKLEIFGGDAFLDEVSDDEEEDEKTADTAAAVIVIETPRIEKGLDLLHDSGLVKEKFWDLDLLEIARQWTLVDHMLFRSLNVASLLASSSSSIPLYHYSYKYGGTKKSIDRFNIGSSWLTYSILTINTPEKRAQHISRLIALAKHMCTLGNFHGLMTALTALQQGCVHRLKITFDMLSEQDKESMQELKVYLRLLFLFILCFLYYSTQICVCIGSNGW
ncbi:hypothetical protein EON65_00700 [archaeon]|nr:MAG: hypothetical protein EON65_00700 [archaeon]